MASHPIPPPSSLPPTVLKWTVITLSDIGPNAWTPKVSFTFPRCMEADPLTSVGPKGWEPDGKASWWPYYQERHKLSPLFWVQGHMLNQLVHGRGTPMNLVPISNTLNTNMSAMVEERVKKMVDAGKILRYVVYAHWEGKMSTGGTPHVLEHPEAIRKAYGIKGVDPNGTLLWGEQFAPTRLSWEVYEYTNWPMKTLKQIVLSESGYDRSQWNNHFPQ